jgi:hypothetical protein
MNLVLAEQNYPRVFSVLKENGWIPGRREIHPDHLSVAKKCGYALHDEAEEFLRNFSGTNFRYLRDPSNPGLSANLSVTLGNLPEQMRLRYDAVCIDRLTGTSETYPVMNTGSVLVFMNPDGKTVGVVHDFAQVSYDVDVFSFMHALFFQEILPGGSSRFLKQDERPYEFRLDEDE